MIKLLCVFTFSIMTIVFGSNRVDGAIVIQVGDGSVPQKSPTGSVTMSVSMYLTDLSGSRTLQGYNLAFDFGVEGKDADYSPFTFAVSNFNPNLGTVTGFDNPDPDANNYDYQVSSADNPAFDISGATEASPLHLFDFNIGFTNAAAGFYDLTQDPNAMQGMFNVNPNTLTGTGVDIDSGDPNIFLSALGGQFEIQGASAVPEPGSMLALAGLFAVGGARQWRRKKRVVN